MRAFKLTLAGVLMLLLASPLAAAGSDDAPVARALERFEASVGSLEPASHRPPPVPDDDNAARWFLDGAAAVTLTAEDGERLRTMVSRDPREWTADEVAELERLVAWQEPALALLRRGGRCPASVFPTLAEDVAAEPAIALVRASRLLLVAGLLELRREPGRAPSLHALATLARGLARQPEMLYTLLGVSAEGHLVRALHVAVEDPDADPALLRELAAGLPAEPASDAFARNVAFMAVEAVTRMEELDADASGDSAEQAKVIDGFRTMVEAARQPAGLAGYQEEVLEEVRDRDAVASAASVVAALLIPNILHTETRLLAMEAVRGVARQAVALRLAAEEGGAYPPTWELHAAPWTSSPPEYQLRPDGSAVLTHPDLAATWEKRMGNTESLPPPTRWLLPARPAAP